MKIAFVTNKRTPYRALQLNEFSKIDNVEITTYYTHKEHENRNWKLTKINEFNEINLKGIKINKKYGYINNGIIRIVTENDLIIIGGYEQPTYIAISLICKILKKPYVICFDGISTNRLNDKEMGIKKNIKKLVISNSSYIMANGKVSKRYFNEIFGYPIEKIYNQYLTVDTKKINNLYENKKEYRKKYREKLNIKDSEKVLIYSGRLIDIKNVDSVIKAINKIKRKDIVFLITGGGELEEELKHLSEELGVRMVITGFISEQEELFKHYFAGDALILPSTYEPWGLVINEAMAAGLPVIVSNICGCSLDLVNSENGKVIDPYDVDDISVKIQQVLFDEDIQKKSNNSRKIISEWNFNNSKKSLTNIINNINIIK